MKRNFKIKYKFLKAENILKILKKEKYTKFASSEFVSSQKSTTQSPKRDENKQIFYSEQILQNVFGKLFDVKMYILAIF